MTENRPSPEPKLPRRKLVRQRQIAERRVAIKQQEVDEKRRILLKAGGIGIVAAALGGLGLAWKFFSDPKSKTEETPRFPTVPPKQAKDQDQLPRETIQYYRKELERFNQEAFKNPQSFKEMAPIIGQLAVEFFCKEMGYDPKRYAGKIRYQPDEEYRRVKSAEHGCITEPKLDSGYEIGYIYGPDGDKLSINLDNVLHEDESRKVVGTYAAFILFGAVIHELYHLSALSLPDPVSDRSGSKLKGLALYIPNQSSNKTDMICWDVFRLQLEEAIVYDSTSRTTNKLNFTVDTSKDFEPTVQRYRSGVIDRLFGGDNKPLLNLHQQSKDQEFFESVGQNLGFPADQSAKEGESYLARLLLQGIY